MSSVRAMSPAMGRPAWKQTLVLCAITGCFTLAFGFASGWSAARVDEPSQPRTGRTVPLPIVDELFDPGPVSPGELGSVNVVVPATITEE
jgi:hypothetical protein